MKTAENNKTVCPGPDAQYYKYIKDGKLCVSTKTELLALGYSDWVIRNGVQFDYISQGEAKTFINNGAFINHIQQLNEFLTGRITEQKMYQALDYLEVTARNYEVSYGNCKVLFKIIHDAAAIIKLKIKDNTGGYFGGTKDQYKLAHTDLNEKLAEICGQAYGELDVMIEGGAFY